MPDTARKYLASSDPQDFDAFWNRYEWPTGQSNFSTGDEDRATASCCTSSCCFGGCCSRGAARTASPSSARSDRDDHAALGRDDRGACGCWGRRRPVTDDDGRGEARQIPRYIDPQFDPQCADRWDTDDPAYLDKVSCECLIKVTGVDPKTSRFELRMKCKWGFRTRHSEELTETKLRVPGVRLPGLIVEVNESRIWKDLQKTKESSNTVFWRGVSLFTITGFERFEMQDFPFDRQLMSLDVFEFVWQQDKDSLEYDFSMHIVSFRIETVSMLPEWHAATALIEACNARDQHPRDSPGGTGDRPPDYANRFTVKLRLQRKNWFYLVQIFGLTIIITLATTLPLLMPSGGKHVGDRLGLYSAGVLTLTSFKYSIGDHLPSVPYSTKFDRVIMTEVCSIIFCALEALVAYRYVDFHHKAAHEESLFDDDHFLHFVNVDKIEILLFILLMLWWFFTWLHLCADRMECHRIARCFGKRFKSWSLIVANQEDQADFDELEDWEHKDDLEVERHGAKQLAALGLEICSRLARRMPTDEHSEDGEYLAQLKEKRDQLEKKITSEYSSAARGEAIKFPGKTPKASGSVTKA